MLLMDEIHISIFVPRGLLEVEYDRIRRTLTKREFRTAFRKAVRRVFRRFSALKRVKVKVSA